MTRGAVTRIREPLPCGAGHVWDDRRPIWTHHDGPRRLAVSGRWRRERRSGGATFVVVMQAAEVRDLHDGAAGRRLHSPWDWRILVQREVPSPLVIVGEVLLEVAAQRALVPPDEVVEALTPQGADHTFHERVLPGRTRRDHDFFDAHGPHRRL